MRIVIKSAISKTLRFSSTFWNSKVSQSFEISMKAVLALVFLALKPTISKVVFKEAPILWIGSKSESLKSKVQVPWDTGLGDVFVFYVLCNVLLKSET